MAVFLINPSDHSFGTAVITPRWLYVLAAATPLSFGDPVIVDETLEALVPRPSRAETWSASAFTPGTPCAATRSAAWRGSAAPGSFMAAFTPRCIPRKPWSVAMLTPWSRATAMWSGPRFCNACMQGAPEPDLRGRQDRCGSVCSRPLGSAAPRQIHVGVGADGSWLPQALLFLLRLAHRRPTPETAEF